MKKRLTQSEEFEIMKLVLDKFLWVGTVIMLYGLYLLFTATTLTTGILWMIIGVIVLVLFMILVVKEYEIVR